ncbi:metal ABC transporter permease [Corynebacterium sp. 335C]
MSFIDFISEFTFRRTVIGTVIIGVAAGMLGCHLYLRKQSMLADVIGHSAVAGVMAAFLVASWLTLDGRSMLAIILGALASGVLAVLLTNWVARGSRVGDDAAMAVALALFFGGGMVLLNVIQESTLPDKGGIDSLMFGNSATLTNADNVTLGSIGAVVVAVALLAHRPMSMLLFDPAMARVSMGVRRAGAVSVAQTAVIVVAVVLGIKAVGLILIIAFAVFPAAAARQWTRSLGTMMPLAAFFGALGGVAGSWASVSFGDLPTGPVIVLALTLIVAVSLVASPRRGLVARALRRRRATAAAVAGAPHPAGDPGAAAAAVPSSRTGGAGGREGAR